MPTENHCSSYVSVLLNFKIQDQDSNSILVLNLQIVLPTYWRTNLSSHCTIIYFIDLLPKMDGPKILFISSCVIDPFSSIIKFAQFYNDNLKKWNAIHATYLISHLQNIINNFFFHKFIFHSGFCPILVRFVQHHNSFGRFFIWARK